MKPPAWLVEFHRLWRKARGLRLLPSTRNFSTPWQDLLDSSGLKSAAERDHAVREAGDWESQGRLVLKRHRYRSYLIESIALPVESEEWLIGIFQGISARDLQTRSLACLERWETRGHQNWPESWLCLCTDLRSAFGVGKNCAPFFWNEPEKLEVLLSALHGLTSRSWPSPTLIRDASTALGFDSKFLEGKQTVLESALGLLFGEDTSFESLGLTVRQSHAMIHGRLSLFFEDGASQHFEHLRGVYTIAHADLQRATRAETTALRILSIENARTTFRQVAAANVEGDTLVLTTAYPNSATRRLLELLPPTLLHHHFGDTDVSGYAILRSLREIGVRPVQAFFMNWREDQKSNPLSEHDRRLLPGLVESKELEDMRRFFVQMASSRRKGHCEQEALGPPDLHRWPYWTALESDL